MAIARFDLTPQAIRASATGRQNLLDSLDVSAYRSGDVFLHVFAFEGVPSLSVMVRMIGGWQTESEDGWLVLATFTAVTAGSATPQRLNLPYLPPYIRWEVSAISGSGALAVFTAKGSLYDTQ